FIEMCDFDDPNLVEMKSYARDVAVALGIRHGAAHTEVMLGSDGPVWIEPGARLAGVSWPLITEACTGYGSVRVLVDALLAETEDGTVPSNGRRYSFPPPSPSEITRRCHELRRRRHGRLVFGISQVSGVITR